MNHSFDRARFSAHVTGRVQGVGYRFFVQRIARNASLTGWVRNEYDGSVSLVVEGPRTELEDLVSRLRTGPGGSRVDGVQVNWDEPTGEFTDFRIR